MYLHLSMTHDGQEDAEYPEIDPGNGLIE